MATGIEVPYTDELKPLEHLLARVRRPGDFFVQGSLEVPLPRVDIRDVGVLSFPVPAAQIEAVIAQSARAPYGRGRETILDTSVRRVWQLAPSKLDIGGKSWLRTFERILSTATEGLGCAGVNVSAELYKLLVYDKGAFFKGHRDTEKAEGMFGTLLIVLPSPHAGGELVVRHAGREATLDLSGGDVSELEFAAFYADCEHEVLPVTHGNRVCLVYNLLQQRTPKGEAQVPLVAPMYETEAAGAAELLGKAFADSNAPTKIAWLLEHQYSPAGLSFAALKNADRARAKVLCDAAARADCAIHLGIVHIEESGPAEYSGHGLRGRRRWRSDDEEQEDVSSEDFEVVEVTDGWSYIDQWLNPEDRAAGFGRLSLGEGEVLPAGALDDEAPDEQRLLEASGNEGVTFERSYHRAALVLWPRSRFVDVLLQAGVRAALPYLEARTAPAVAETRSDTERLAMVAEAHRVVKAWEAHVDDESEGVDPDLDFDPDSSWGDDLGEDADAGTNAAADRNRMIALLRRLADAELLERFLHGVVTLRFNGDEAAPLAESARLLGATRCGALFSRLIRHNMRAAPRGCVNLFARLVAEHGAPTLPDWATALREIATAVVDGLRAPAQRASRAENGSPGTARKGQPADGATLADLLDALAALEAPRLRAAACAAIVADGNPFDPRSVIVPALRTLCDRGRMVIGDAAGERLWLHAADTLLAQSEYPPVPPQDWRQDVKLSCNCEDCRELQSFAAHPSQQTHRFRVRQDRRQHLHRQIERHGLDMTHVTERKGSPQTLVCTKTRRTYLRRREEYRQDVAALAALAELVRDSPGELAPHCARIAAVRERAAASAD
jgi:hypothetical protein